MPSTSQSQITVIETTLTIQQNMLSVRELLLISNLCNLTMINAGFSCYHTKSSFQSITRSISFWFFRVSSKSRQKERERRGARSIFKQQDINHSILDSTLLSKKQNIFSSPSESKASSFQTSFFSRPLAFPSQVERWQNPEIPWALFSSSCHLCLFYPSWLYACTARGGCDLGISKDIPYPHILLWSIRYSASWPHEGHTSSADYVGWFWSDQSVRQRVHRQGKEGHG